MADITMCDNTLCPLRDGCYRAQAKPSDWQSYASYSCLITSSGIYCDNQIQYYRQSSSDKSKLLD
jgi:hypothetical protein